MIPTNVELHIEELLLHGFAAKDRDRIGEIIQHELTRLLSEGGLPPSLVQGGEMTRLDGGGFQVAAGAKPEAIGVQIAQSIYGGLGQ
ncbi:hypothetical protein [Nostoc sp. CCY 9925]|uniref:hypothetical protein n=1 Tax=Nostoc sp. CCY 9925 TaxID=3103865 RepID=UPI0039C62956